MHGFSPLRTLLCISLGAAALPAHAIDDEGQFTLRASALRLDANTDVDGRTTYQGTPYEFAEQFDFGSAKTSPRLEGTVRFGERSRLHFNYFSYSKAQDASLDEAISFDNITLPEGSFARLDTDFRVAGVAYDYAVVETPTASVGLQLGVEYARLKGDLFAQAGPDTYQDDGDADGYLPVLGVRAEFAPADKWRIVLQGQHFNTSWGSFGDTEGTLTRANALVEYRFTPHVGVHAGYDYFRLDAQNRDEDDDGIVGLDQKFHGPMVGVSFMF